MRLARGVAVFAPCLVWLWDPAAAAAEAEVGSSDSVVGIAAGDPVRLAEVDARSHGVVSRYWAEIDEAKRRALEDRLVELVFAGDRVEPATAAESGDAAGLAGGSDVRALAAALLRTSGPLAADERAEIRDFAREVARREAMRRARVAHAQERLAEIPVERFVPEPRAGGVAPFPDIVARIPEVSAPDGGTIRDADLERAARLRLFRLRGRIVAEARAQFAAIADERLLAREAARRGLATPALLARVDGAAPPVRDAEVAAYYEAHRNELDGFHPERIRSYLAFRRRAEARDALLAALRAEDPPRFLLSPPEPPRFSGPTRVSEQGSRAATVSLVVFSNDGCRPCGEAARVVERLAARHPDRLRVVRRHLFPRGALAGWWSAAGTVCEDVRGNREAFSRCRRAPATLARIEKDLQAAAEIGFEEAPSFLLNGLPLTGFQGEAHLAALLATEVAGGSTPPSNRE